MALFEDTQLTTEEVFRGIVLYGRNVASYKFALAESLIGLARESSGVVSLEDLAAPFSAAICRHLESNDKQIVSGPSRFLDVLRAYNKDELSRDEMLSKTVSLGLRGGPVIDAFHNVGPGEVSIRMFVDERKNRTPGIQLTDDMLKLVEGDQFSNLGCENDARWRLVETAWELALPTWAITVDYDREHELLFAKDHKDRRHSITGIKDAISGYQEGKCFYCARSILITEPAIDTGSATEVDHVFPHLLMKREVIRRNLDAAWNLVLACHDCNGAGGKWAQCPDLTYVERLYRRNEHYVCSHHPLRETIVESTGATGESRKNFLQRCYDAAKRALITTWRC